jgi:hypothetical protein
MINVQDDFDAWLNGMDDLLDVQNQPDMVNNGGEHVAAEMEGEEVVGAEMEGVEEDVVAEIEEVQDVVSEIEEVQDGVVEIEEVQDDVADIEEVQDVVAETPRVRGYEYDDLTAGEQVIFDVMFDIHHPKFYVDDNGVYRYRED